MKKCAINQRREKVSYLLIKSKNESEIAEELCVHRNTVVRDVKFLKKHSQSWLDGLAKDGFIFEYKLGLDKIRDHERKLQDSLNEAKNVPEKVSILKALDDNQKLYLELLGETPTVHAFRKALTKANVQTA